MTKGPMEVAILGLLLQTEPGLRVEHLVDFDPTEGLATEADDLDLAGALELMVSSADPVDVVDHVWMARSLVLARRHPDAGEVEDGLHALAVALMSPWDLPDPETAAEDLVAAVDRMLVGQPLTTDALDHLVSACNGNLVVAGSTADPQLELSGTMGAFATMLIELATDDLSCRSSIHEVEVDGEMKEAVFVEVDVCTNKPFAEVSRAIDPRRWPEANPFFLSVTVQGTPTIAGKDWSGVVKEVVGPGVNGSVYVTDLAVTYLERPGMAITSFDLPPERHDDGRVTVDRGFLSATDEGLHRRVRTLKVYRIEDLTLPPTWICPLWSQQVVLAGWWSG